MRQTKIQLHKYFSPTDADFESGLVFHSGADKYHNVLFAMNAPSSPEWCSSCNGTGSRSKWDVQGLDIDSMIQDDPDSAEAYWSGATDVRCDQCDGRGVHAVVNYELCTADQKRVLDANSEVYHEEAMDEAYAAAERRAGA